MLPERMVRRGEGNFLNPLDWTTICSSSSCFGLGLSIAAAATSFAFLPETIFSFPEGGLSAAIGESDDGASRSFSCLGEVESAIGLDFSASGVDERPPLDFLRSLAVAPQLHRLQRILAKFFLAKMECAPESLSEPFP